MINIKKQKEKFLEDYFSLCIEHGFCIDVGDKEEVCVEDWPSYIYPKEIDPWVSYKQELRESIK